MTRRSKVPSYVELKEDRYSIGGVDNNIFLKRGIYKVVRYVEGLGCLVIVGGTKRKPEYSIIRQWV